MPQKASRPIHDRYPTVVALLGHHTTDETSDPVGALAPLELLSDGPGSASSLETMPGERRQIVRYPGAEQPQLLADRMSEPC
jgi:hypothetical protein